MPQVFIGLVSLMVSVHNANEAKGTAKRQERNRNEQASLQARLAQAKARREGRIRKARFAAGNAGVSSGSIVSGFDSGVSTQLEGQTDIIKSQTDLQKEQNAIGRQQTEDAANASIATSVADFMKVGVDYYESLPEKPTTPTDTVSGESK